jgi:hypothetical protein
MSTKKEGENQKVESEKKQKETLLKDSAYSLCPVHRVQYPRGASCPKC